MRLNGSHLSVPGLTPQDCASSRGHRCGTHTRDQIPWRAIGPAYFNEYEARAGYYDEWLQQQLGHNNVPATPEERHKLLMEKRIEAYQNLCDIVYEKKGFNSDGI